MITLFLNGREITTEHQSLTEALAQWQVQNSPCAIAINEQFIPKSAYETTVLKNHDRVEMLSPMQGG